MKSHVPALGALLLALVQAPPASAQTREPPAEFVALIDTIEDDTGLKRFGAPKISDLDDGATDTLKVKVDNAQVTFLQLACDGYCLEIKPTVTTRAGAVIAPELPDPTLPVIQVPAGSGDEVDLSVAMTCDYAYCTFGVQALTR